MADNRFSGVAMRCQEFGGLLKIDLGELRQELGFSRLGRQVLDEISSTLRSVRLGFFPDWVLDSSVNLEPRQHQEIWLYLSDGGSISQVISAIQDPVNVDVPQVLSLISGNRFRPSSPEEKIRAIQEILGPSSLHSAE